MEERVRTKIHSSEITSETNYLSRRDFIKAAGLFLGGAGLLAACSSPISSVSDPKLASTNTLPPQDRLTSFEDITNFNNYYEFTPDKTRVAGLAKNFRVSPWNIEISGLVHKPKTLGIEDILDKFPREERVYRLRCVEGWSMVIPWLGFELNQILKEVEPMTSAKYVKFTTLNDPEQMPGLNSGFYPWPYTEGLRLDEAMHSLTILATGLYGKELPNQNGAPLRLVVPWKYGFKSAKAIVKIELVAEQPSTFWNIIAPDEYGFYSNVNPNVPHPRWPQMTERRIGETGRRPTLFLNGYAEEVGYLYDGMNLVENY